MSTLSPLTGGLLPHKEVGLKLLITIEVDVDSQSGLGSTLDSAISKVKQGVTQAEEYSASGSYSLQVKEVDPLWKVLVNKAFSRKGLEASEHDFLHVQSEGWVRLSYELMIDKIEDYASQVANG